MWQFIVAILVSYVAAGVIGLIAYKIGYHDGTVAGGTKIYDYFKKLEESRQRYYEQVNLSLNKMLNEAYGVPVVPKPIKNGKLTVLKPEKGEDK